MTKSLTRTEIAALLAKHDKNMVKDILAQVDAAAAIEKKGTNVELRKAAHRKALKENNAIELNKVTAAQDRMLPAGQQLASQSEQIMETGLDVEQAAVAMQSYLDGKLVAETQTAIQELVRTLVFRSMDLAAAEEGEEFPEQTNMVLDVPELGKRFCREGAGRKPASIDLDALRAAVGEELFAEITTEKVVVTREINEDALSVAVLANPELLEQVRDAVLPGDWKPARLMVRDIPAQEANQE